VAEDLSQADQIILVVGKELVSGTNLNRVSHSTSSASLLFMTMCLEHKVQSVPNVASLTTVLELS